MEGLVSQGIKESPLLQCGEEVNTAIHTGLTHHGWAYRYCFEDPQLAQSELEKLQEMDEEPSGFIARRWGQIPAAPRDQYSGPDRQA